jgi:hypothetical protein
MPQIRHNPTSNPVILRRNLVAPGQLRLSIATPIQQPLPQRNIFFLRMLPHPLARDNELRTALRAHRIRPPKV